MNNTLPTPVEYVVLSGPEFDVATQGEWRSKVAAWLATPRLKYYMRRSDAFREADLRTFFLAHTPAEMDEDSGLSLARAIGIIELQISPYDDREVWFKYLTVDPDYQRKGVAKKLLALMVEHLKANPRLLARSRASDEGALKVQGYIDQLLDEAGVRWKQTGREERSTA